MALDVNHFWRLSILLDPDYREAQPFERCVEQDYRNCGESRVRGNKGCRHNDAGIVSLRLCNGAMNLAQSDWGLRNAGKGLS